MSLVFPPLCSVLGLANGRHWCKTRRPEKVVLSPPLVMPWVMGLATAVPCLCSISHQATLCGSGSHWTGPASASNTTSYHCYYSSLLLLLNCGLPHHSLSGFLALLSTVLPSLHFKHPLFVRDRVGSIFLSGLCLLYFPY